MNYPEGYLKHIGNIKCEICEKILPVERFTNHPLMAHNIRIKDYYDKYLKKENEGICICGNPTKFWSLINGYRQFCSVSCLNKNVSLVFNREIIEYNNFICQLCNKGFRTINCLSKHLSIVHNQNCKDYYDKYLKKENEGICKICKKPTRYYDIRKGYNTYCCNSCGTLDPDVQTKTKKTCNKKYGPNWFSLIPNISPIGTECLNYIEEKLNIQILREQKFLKYSVDGLMKEFDLVIEFDGYHNYKCYKTKTLTDHDIKKQKIIESLGYIFFRIDRKDWLSNKEKIIESFKQIIEEKRAKK